MKDTNKKRFSHKGDSVVEVNNRIVEEAVKNMTKIPVDNNWINLTYKERKNLSFEQLVQIDNKQKNWERLIKHYSDMFGVIPSQSRFIMSENDRIALENNKSSKKR